MGVNIKENQRLLDYQLIDFLELKLSKRERKLALTMMREKTSFPTVSSALSVSIQ